MPAGECRVSSPGVDLKLDRETRDQIATANRNLSDVRGEIAALKLTIEKLNREIAQMKAKTEPSSKKF